MKQQRKGRLMLMLLLVLFLLPVVIGLVLYIIGWQPAGSSYGTLLQPPQKLDIPVLQTLEGESIDKSSWGSKWHLVYIAPASCNQECRSDLSMMRQIHVALAKQISRLQRVWLVDGGFSPETRQIQSLYPDMLVLTDTMLLARQLDSRPGRADSRIYLIDPLGNLTMTYPKGSDPYGILNDLKKLLKYSWVG